MNIKNAKTQTLRQLFMTQKTVIMSDLQVSINTNSRMTVYRHLEPLNYLSSYSNRGKYYALRGIARFNKYGIYRYESICFCKDGTLKELAKRLVDESNGGFFASELKDIVTVKAHDVLLELLREKRLVWDKLCDEFIYFSKSVSIRREQQKRWYSGLKSLKIGYGGDSQMAALLDISEATVAKGRKEILSGKIDIESTRKLGGGRKTVVKKEPTIIDRIERLMEYETAGDPMSGMKWTRKTTEKISTELKSIGIFVSKTTVARLLREMDFSLKSNSKKISNGGKFVSTEDQKKRDKQFKYLERKRREYEKNGDPIISVDTKKKELIGNSKNAGTRLKRQADITNDHDYLSYALGKAALYGIYDTVKNSAYVCIGKLLREGNAFSSSDTPQFAVESIAEWWTKEGRLTYPCSTKLLILADAGGSNGYKPPAF